MANKKTSEALQGEKLDQLRDAFSAQLEAQFQRGVAEGAYATYRMIYTYITDPVLTDAGKLKKLAELSDVFFTNKAGKELLEKHHSREKKNGEQ